MFLETKKEGEVRTFEPWRQVLLNAAALLERDGWCQLLTMNERGERCILGAVGRMWWEPPVRTAVEALASRLGGGTGVISYWNDEPGRTKEEVIALLREVGTKGD